MPRFIAVACAALAGPAYGAHGYAPPKSPLGRRAFAERVASFSGTMAVVASRASYADNMVIPASTSSSLVGDTVSYDDFSTIMLRGEAEKVN